MKSPVFVLLVFFFTTQVAAGRKTTIADRQQISQYRVTWIFDKPARSAPFVTGNWWVAGPVNNVKITPAAGPVHTKKLDIKINHWNNTSLKRGTTVRNGSTIIIKAGRTQGYDSRSASFRKEDAVTLQV